MQPLSEQNSLNKNAFSGNWRDYFTLHPSLEYRESVERAMDNIVATGEDGIQLLMAAHHNSVAIAYGDKAHEKPVLPKIEIRQSASEIGSSVLLFMPMTIHLDEDAYINVMSGDRPERLSINATLVHELFHMADPKARHPDAMLQQYLEQSLKTDDLSPEQRATIIQHYRNAYDTLKEHYADALESKTSPNNPESTQIIATVLPPYSAITDLHERVNKWSIASKEWVWPSSFSLEPFNKTQQHAQAERDATSYTDMFMSKHFPGEPRRQNYSNAMLEETPSAPILRELGCGDVWLGGYKPATVTLDDLGTLSQPSISYSPSPACDKQRD